MPAHDLPSFDALYEALTGSIRKAVYYALAHRHAYDMLMSAHAPLPLFSALMPACLESGRDAADGADQCRG